MGTRWRRGACALVICGLVGCGLVLGWAGCELGDAGETGDEPIACAQGSAIGYRPCIQADLEALGCTSCHAQALPGSGMRVIPGPRTEQEWQENYGDVRLQARGGVPIRLVAKARGGGGHVAAGAQAEPVLQRWIEWGARGAPFASQEATGGEGP